MPKRFLSCSGPQCFKHVQNAFAKEEQKRILTPNWDALFRHMNQLHRADKRHRWKLMFWYGRLHCDSTDLLSLQDSPEQS